MMEMDSTHCQVDWDDDDDNDDDDDDDEDNDEIIYYLSLFSHRIVCAVLYIYIYVIATVTLDVDAKSADSWYKAKWVYLSVWI